MAQKTILEYIWLDINGQLRSKTRIVYNTCDYTYIPDWNYDGSSTGQANVDGNSEIILKPCKHYKNPLTPSIPSTNSFLVLCDCTISVGISNRPVFRNRRRGRTICRAIFTTTYCRKIWRVNMLQSQNESIFKWVRWSYKFQHKSVESRWWY